LWLGPADVPEHQRQFEDLTLAMMPAGARAAAPLCSALQEGAEATGGVAQAVAKALARRFRVQSFVSVDPRLAQVLSMSVSMEGEGEGAEAGVPLLLRALFQALDRAAVLCPASSTSPATAAAVGTAKS
jgi:hypothetical protein